jgi:hypothetical protein
MRNPSMPTLDFHSLLDGGSAGESQAPAAPSGRELQELLSPLSCEEFVNDYFARVSLSVAGKHGKFDQLFGWERLKQALARGKTIPDKSHNITASFTSGEDSGSARGMISAQHGQVSELLTAGATVCISNIHMADPVLAGWASAIRAQLGFTGTVGVHCYVSPDNSGLPMHFDRRVATTLQIAGKKVWRYSTEAAKAWPDDNGVYREGKVEPAWADPVRMPAEMEFREVELNPGDLLCLPAGAWHAARGVGYSLALNLYFAPRNLFLQLAPLLQAFASASGEWRGGPPATLERAQGQMPQAVRAYLHERLEEFHQKALQFIEDPDALAEPWLNSLAFEPYTGWQPFTNVAMPKVTATQRFRVAPSALQFIETKGQVVVPSDYGALRFPATFGPTLRRMSSEGAGFSIPELLSWQQGTGGPSPDEILAHLAILYRSGLLRPA